jgi:hypothetical protein
MTTASKPCPRVKPERRIRLLHRMTDRSAAVVAITVGKEEGVYAVRLMPSDFGTAFHLIKGELIEDTDAETLRLRNAAEYDVLLNGRESSCTCPGHTYHGHCKHVDGLTTLRQRNLI